MNSIVQNSLFFGVVLTFFAYEIGLIISKKFKLALFNPLLIATIFIIGILLLFDIEYETYQQGAKYISYFLTPATVSLAIPLYRQLELLKKHPVAIMGGILAGVLTALLSIFVMSLLFDLNHEQYVTLLPKSITTAIGMGVSEKMGGLVALTVVAISVTGITGNVMARFVLKMVKVKDPIAQGLAIGTSSHALGTTKAMEIGQVQGAMSSLAIVVAGVLTVVFSGIFANFI